MVTSKKQLIGCAQEVLPKLPDVGEAHIPDKELDITVARSGGPELALELETKGYAGFRPALEPAAVASPEDA